MSGEVLRPCPICGKKVSIARTDNEVGERWWFITRGTYRTTRCNCRLFLESEKFTCGWNEDYSLECRAKLIDKWNIRAHGTLTAEQVREAIEKRFDFDVWVPKERWQAIADELNGVLGSGTCEVEADEPDGWHKCPECGCVVGYWLLNDGSWTIYMDDYQIPYNNCPECGKAV
jgi:endogenous inhibitor of DNA gyrase (YacG/DUF329 family)